MSNELPPLTQEPIPLNKRTLPQSELDLQLMTTESVWGKREVSPEIIDKLNRFFVSENERGEKEVTVSSLWGLLGYYTRDMRLANLSTFNGELQYCQYYLDLAGDFLRVDEVGAFLDCLARVATMLELSQSKSGFLRRKLNTFTQEHIQQQNEPPKKSLFGIGKRGDETP